MHSHSAKWRHLMRAAVRDGRRLRGAVVRGRGVSRGCACLRSMIVQGLQDVATASGSCEINCKINCVSKGCHVKGVVSVLSGNALATSMVAL